MLIHLRISALMETGNKMLKMDVKDKLVELLAEYFNIGDSYAYNLTRVKSAFACGTVGLDDFEEFDDEMVKDIASYLTDNGVTVQEWALPEEEYYVLRNTETGMYFRGKGVNRWGKHFNQATIYRVKGTAEHSIKEVAWHGEKAELVRIKIVEMPQPPKGE